MSTTAIESYVNPEDRLITQMIIPVSEKTFFNTKWKPVRGPLCAYDMIYHPPDYDPKSSRSDRTDPHKIRQHIWEQEFPKPESTVHESTNHFMYGRPYWKILDKPTKEFVRTSGKSENNHMRVYTVLEWAVLLYNGKEGVCV